MNIHQIASLILLLTIWASQSGIVEAKSPPADDLPPTTGGQSAGSRGCGIDQQALQQLIPPLSQAQTNNTTPTLAWHSDAETESKLEFRVFQYDPVTQQSQLVVELMNPFVQRVDNLSILDWPNSVPPLQANTQYIWQVEIVCEPNRPSGNIFADAPLKTLADAQPQRRQSQLGPDSAEPKSGYDRLATMIRSKSGASFQAYFSSLKDNKDIDLAWSRLIQN